MRLAYPANTPRLRRIYWWSVFLLLLVASLLGLYAYLFSPDWLRTAGQMPVALHSPLRADYSADLRGMRPISLSLELVSDAARDQVARENDPLPGLIALLQTPVPTATSFLPATPTRQAAAPVTPTAQEEIPPPKSTSTLPWTPTSTKFITFTPTSSVTPSMTLTRRPPTATAVITRTKEVFTPTLPPTKVPPTATPVTPTPTRTPPPTPTNPPPTGYPPPDTPAPTGYPYP